MPAAALQDPWALLDRGLMTLYLHSRRNANRLARVLLTLLPLMLLLVGSCKTSAEAASVFGDPQSQVRYALFPDRLSKPQGAYQPARGYVVRAQKYVVGAPQSLMQLTEQELTFIFGKPALERRDADARIWQYKTEACVVDFYFYQEDGVAAGHTVSHVDYRMKEHLVPGALVTDEPVPMVRQSRCLETLARAGSPFSPKV